MVDTARHTAWSSGESYELCIGRWGRRIAQRFLDRLGPAPGLDWVEVGCGTGALSEAILRRANPARLTAVEPSTAFLAIARETVSDPRASFLAGDAQALPLPDASADIVVSGLVLNFVPDRALALAEMRRLLRPDGTLAFYVWDYPGGGVSFIRAFWAAAVALDPAAAPMTEAGRYAFCTSDGLTQLVRSAGLRDVEVAAVEDFARFRDFDDFWRPFTFGAGAAQVYCAGLSDAARDQLRHRLKAQLPAAADGSITLPLRAWAVQARA